MKNVTITLPEEIALQAKVSAAQQGKSLSRYISELLTKTMSQPEKEDPLKVLLALGPWPSADKTSKDDIYADRIERLLHRHQHLGVSDG